MSNKNGASKLRAFISYWRTILTVTNKKELDVRMDDKEAKSDEAFTRGGSDDDTDTIDPGKRSDTWFDRIERITQENRKRSIENAKTLSNVDLRTVWLMRILIAILATILSTRIVSAF
jgi:hypothetical protein